MGQLNLATELTPFVEPATPLPAKVLASQKQGGCAASATAVPEALGVALRVRRAVPVGESVPVEEGGGVGERLGEREGEELGVREGERLPLLAFVMRRILWLMVSATITLPEGSTATLEG